MSHENQDTRNHDGSGHFRERAIEKPMDKPPKKYDNSETVPENDFSADPLAENFENPGDLSKRFM